MALPIKSFALTPPRFSLTAPPPRVVLVPDHLFFIRVVPIADAATAADVKSQVELALEGLSPFPLAQLYYAHYWKEGARSALIYAAYRKRFTSEQVEGWSDAEMVLPAFATLLTAEIQPSTTIILTQEENLTAVHWGESTTVPAAVVARSWQPDTLKHPHQFIVASICSVSQSVFTPWITRIWICPAFDEKLDHINMPLARSCH